MKETYYHVTTSENAERILKEGLKPVIGEKRTQTEDDRTGIFLCKRKDVPYWKIILGRCVVLKVEDVNVHKRDFFHYWCYDEYEYKGKVIPPSNIKREYVRTTAKANKNLCMSYLYVLSNFTVDCARYYTGNEFNIDPGDLRYDAELLMSILPHLDFSAVPTIEIREELSIACDNGACTFDDIYSPYLREGKERQYRLWQMLVRYPKDDLTELRTKIYRYMKKYLKGALDVNTGGWTR